MQRPGPFQSTRGDRAVVRIGKMGKLLPIQSQATPYSLAVLSGSEIAFAEIHDLETRAEGQRRPGSREAPGDAGTIMASCSSAEPDAFRRK
jgi:hypothetical protein